MSQAIPALPPLPASRAARTLAGLELAGLLAFALGYPLSKALANVGLVLLLTAFVGQLPVRWQALRRDPFCRLSAAWILWLLAFAGWQAAQGSHPRPFGGLTEVIGFGFIPLLAWAVRGEPQRVRSVLACALLGVLLRMLADLQWSGGLPSLPYGADEIMMFGVNRNISGAILASALLGALLLPLAWRRAFGPAALLANLALVGLLAWIWVVIHSRATWIALLLALPVALALLPERRRPDGPPSWRPHLFTLGVLLLMSLVLWFGRGELMERLGQEAETRSALMSGNLKELPETSIGIRVRLFQVALALWQEHPLTGWGAQIQHLFGHYGNYPDAVLFAQLHNGYLEMLARTGLIGAAFAALTLLLLLRTLWRARHRDGRLSPPLAAFLAGAGMVFLVVNGSISFQYFQHGWHYMVLLGGLIAGYALPAPSPLRPRGGDGAVVFLTSRGGQARYFAALSASMPCPSRVERLRGSLGEWLHAWFRADLDPLPADAAVNAMRLKMGERLNGLSFWQHLAFAAHPLPTYLGAVAQLRMYKARLLDAPPRAIAVWNGEKFRQSLAAAAATQLGIPVLRFENGLMPRTATVDLRGVNARNSVPRDPDFFRAIAAARGPWQGLELAPRQAMEGKTLQSTTRELPARYLFIPFQVDNDTQILNNSPWIRDMRHLYHSLVALLPRLADGELQLVFKEHPSTTRSYPDLHKDAAGRPRVHFINDRPLPELLRQAQAVITINSTVGIEALLCQRPVITLGAAFYNIEGLVQHADGPQALCEAIARLPGWSCDEALRTGFFHYLAEDYAVPGVPRNAEPAHLQAMASRIVQLLAQTESA